MRYRKGDIVTYVGKHAPFPEEEFIGMVGRVVKVNEKWGGVSVEWFKTSHYDERVPSGVYPKNIELFGSGGDDEI